MSSDFTIMSASAFFTHKAIRIPGIPEVVVTGFIVIAVLSSEFNKGWFLGLKGRGINMFLSIIIPIYNDEKYLEECLDSCIDQDLLASDYEIICVDDGSVDKTHEILREYAQKYSNIKLIFNQHQGGGRGRNTGLEHACGQYVWFVDHDDLISSKALGCLKETAIRTECDRINFPCYIFNEQLSPEELQAKKENKLKPDFITYRGTIWSSILKRSFLIENDIWPLSKMLIGVKCWGSDGFFIDETRLAGASVTTIEDKPYYYYRVSAIQQTAKHNYQANMSRMDGTIGPVLVLKKKYDQEVQEYGKAREITADVLMSWLHVCMMYLALMEKKSYTDGMKKIKDAGIFPMKIVPEYSYSLSDCINDHKKKGEGTLRIIGYYYSSYRLGFMLYRATFWKVYVKRILNKLSSNEKSST